MWNLRSTNPMKGKSDYMKSYGGFITVSPMGEEYFKDLSKKNILRVNLARHGISIACRDGGYKGVYVPAYICKSVLDTLEADSIPYRLYHINEDFEPDVDSIDEGYTILIVNYFGIHSPLFYEKMSERYERAIFDNTQAFFCKPIIKREIYSIYSPRKFFPVCDGGYVITESFNKQWNLDEDFSGERAGYILRATEEGTDPLYNLYSKMEEELCRSKGLRMSRLTRYILSNQDYSKIKDIRIKNFKALRESLEEINQLRISENSPAMVYPLLLNNDIRKTLIKNRVYVSQWWKWVLDNNPNEWEERLSRYLLPLPIDQRYGTADMEDIVKIIREAV